MSHLEEKFLRQWEATGLDGSDITREFIFQERPRYRFDFAFPSQKVAVEIHGFGYGHQKIAALARDSEKTRAALKLGWVVIPFTSKCLGSKQKLIDAVDYVSYLICDLAERKTPELVSKKPCTGCGRTSGHSWSCPVFDTTLQNKNHHSKKG